MTRPTTLPTWATDADTTLEPSAGKKAVGFLAGKAFPIKWINWLLNNLSGWTNYLDDISVDQYPVSRYANLNAAHAAAAAAGGAVVVDVSTTMTGSLVTTAPLQVQGGGSINNSAALTINGPFVAAPVHVFKGVGAVRFGQGQVHEILPQWWGFSGGNDTSKAATNRAALQACLTAAITTDGLGASDGSKLRVVIPADKYYISDYVDVPPGVIVQGTGAKNYDGCLISAFPTNKTKDLFHFLQDGYHYGGQALRDIALANAKSAVLISESSHTLVENVCITGSAIGLEVYDSIWCAFHKVDTQACTTGLKMYGNTGSNTYSNNNSFVACLFRGGTTGVRQERGVTNSYINCNFENNSGHGVELDGVLGSAAGVAATCIYQVVGTLGQTTFAGCHFEANALGALSGLDDQGSTFTSCSFFGASAGPVISLDRCSDISFHGGMLINYTDFAQTVALGPHSFRTDLRGLKLLSRGDVMDLGINNRVFDEVQRVDNVSLLANPGFREWSGGAPVSWTKGENASGAITADAASLVRPAVHTPYSAKFAFNGAPPSTMYLYQVFTPAAETRYYSIIEYDTGAVVSQDNVNDGLRVSFYDPTNDKYWNFVTQSWAASTDNDCVFFLPRSAVPTCVAVPFTSPAGVSTIRVFLSNRTTGANSANAIYHVYSCDVKTTKAANPYPTVNMLADGLSPTFGEVTADHFIGDGSLITNLAWPQLFGRTASPERILENTSFNKAGAGGADVFDSWTEFNTGGSSGTFTQESDDLCFPHVISQYAAKLTMVSSPTLTPGMYQQKALPAGAHYIVAAYRNESGSAPLGLYVYDVTDDKYLNPATGLFTLSSTVGAKIELPVSATPRYVAVVFTAPSGHDIRVSVAPYADDPATPANNVFRIYYVGFQRKVESPNPFPGPWDSAPTAGQWSKGETIFYTEMVAGTPMGCTCTVTGSPGTWVVLPLMPS